MPSEHARKRLRWSDGTPQAPDRVEERFREAGLACFPAVIRAFAELGGGQFHTDDRRFKIHTARVAVLAAKRWYGEEGRAADPDRFRIPFGESETVQSSYLMDGHGRLYEDGQPLAPGLAEWIEAMGRA